MAMNYLKWLALPSTEVGKHETPATLEVHDTPRKTAHGTRPTFCRSYKAIFIDRPTVIGREERSEIGLTANPDDRAGIPLLSVFGCWIEVMKGTEDDDLWDCLRDQKQGRNRLLQFHVTGSVYDGQSDHEFDLRLTGVIIDLKLHYPRVMGLSRRKAGALASNTSDHSTILTVKPTVYQCALNGDVIEKVVSGPSLWKSEWIRDGVNMLL